MRFLFTFFLIVAFFSCREKKTPWLQGNEQDKLHTIATQIPGFDDFMRELSGRYQDLYYAGRRQNWDLANYQLTKMKEGLDAAVKQKPEFKESVNIFRQTAYTKVEEGLARKDSVLFTTGMRLLTVSCNACHIQNNVGFIKVRLPEN